MLNRHDTSLYARSMSLTRAAPARAPARSAPEHRRGVARGLTRRAPLARASSDDASAQDASDGDASSISPVDLRVLQERMETIRAREASLDVLRILVLDASVPKQVLPLQFDGDNPARELNAGTRLGGVGLGDAFGMLGQAPSNGQILPNGVEVVVTRLMTKPSGRRSSNSRRRGGLRLSARRLKENGVPAR